MREWALPVPIALDLAAAERDRLGVPAGPLGLRRVWPREAGHLGLEFVTTDGSPLAGQWFADRDRLDAVARETARAGQAPVAIVPGPGILVQARGADRRLPALAPLAARAGATLLMHRPERSAVLRLQAADGTRYVKVVRPKLVEVYAATGRVAQQLAGAAFTTPRLLEVDAVSGVIVWSGLAGASLFGLLGTDRLVPAMPAVGEALKALHAAPPPAGVAPHGAVEEIRRLEVWLARLEVFLPDLHGALAAAAPAVCGALAAASSPTVLLHGDFCDKQVIVDEDGRIGLVDFDAMATGEAALDVANAIAVFEVRAIQGLCPPGQAEEAIAAFLAGYRPSPDVLARMNAYVDGARLRLACLSAFRPAWAHCLPALLLDRLGRGYGDRSGLAGRR